MSQAEPEPKLVRAAEGEVVERARGIEPPSQAWEAYALPLSYARPRRLFLA